MSSPPDSAAIRAQVETEHEPLNLRSYYIDFDPTGVYEIDKILSAVARAAKSYHSTEGWSEDEDEERYSYPPFTGATWNERIQNAANEAATQWRARVPEEQTNT